MAASYLVAKSREDLAPAFFLIAASAVTFATVSNCLRNPQPVDADPNLPTPLPATADPS